MSFDLGEKKLKAFQLYKFTFYGFSKAVKPSIEKIKTSYGEKLVFMYSKKSKLGLQTDLYVMPLTNFLTVSAVIAGSAILAALGLTAVILSKVQKIANVAIPLFVLPALFLFRKDISKGLNKALK